MAANSMRDTLKSGIKVIIRTPLVLSGGIDLATMPRFSRYLAGNWLAAAVILPITARFYVYSSYIFCRYKGIFQWHGTEWNIIPWAT
jgi:hypothetical protein